MWRTPAALLLLAASVAAPAREAQDVWKGARRVVAVGDVHGDFEQFVTVLRSAGIVDGRLNWVGRKTHLVQTGDLLDRGPESRKVMDLLMKLEPQARRAGGWVHSLIGNHEAMNLYGDLRYVTPAEFAAFRIEGTEEPDPSSPPGYAEHRRQFSPEGKYGKWIREKNAVIRIDDTVFLHGGISPRYALAGIRAINERVREELSDPAKLEGGVVTDPEGPLWYRGLANGDEAALEAHLDGVLKNLRARRIVIGHTFTDGAVEPRFGGKVAVIDIGLSRAFDTKPRQACLVIERGQAYALHRGKLIALPAGGPAELLGYYRAAAALDPPPSPLEKRIAELAAKAVAAPVPY